MATRQISELFYQPAELPISLSNGSEVTITHGTITNHKMIVQVFERINRSAQRLNNVHESNTHPSGSITSASSVWNSSLDAWKASQADGGSLYWQPASGQQTPSWWMYESPTPITVSSYLVNPNTGDGPDHMKWLFKGGDGTDFVILDDKSAADEVFTRGIDESRLYALSTPATYTHFRWEFSNLFSTHWNTQSGVINKLWLMSSLSVDYEQLHCGRYDSTSPIGVRRIDGTTTKLRNQSGNSLTIYPTIFTP